MLFAFSDPAGAKLVLSCAKKYRDLFKSVVAVSDRVYPFYEDFSIEVQNFGLKTPHDWLVPAAVDLLITGTSVPISLEIALITEAQAVGVTSIALIDHWTNMAMRFKKDDSLMLPSWIFVIDERARRLAIEDGIPASKIVVAGNPYYEYIAAWSPKIAKTAFLKSIELPSDAVYVLYAPEPISSFGLHEKYGFTELDGINMIYKAMRPVLSANVYIIIKGHPNQRDDVFLTYIAELADCRLRYFKNVDFNSLLYYSERVFGFFSNSLIEAKIIGKLVIRPLMMKNNSAVDPLETLESDQFLSFYDSEAFTKAIHDLA